MTSVTIGVWGGQCQLADDTFCLIDGADCVSDHEFCMLTNEPFATNYNYTAVMGFGKPTPGSYEAMMDSLMGQFWRQQEYVPAATFDLNFEG